MATYRAAEEGKTGSVMSKLCTGLEVSLIKKLMPSPPKSNYILWNIALVLLQNNSLSYNYIVTKKVSSDRPFCNLALFLVLFSPPSIFQIDCKLHTWVFEKNIIDWSKEVLAIMQGLGMGLDLVLEMSKGMCKTSWQERRLEKPC